jgi:proteasome alpha subunit
MMSYKAGSIGSGRSIVMEIFEDKFKANMTMDASIKLGLESLLAATDESKLNTMGVEIGVVKKSNPFQKMDPKKVADFVKNIK